MKMAGRSTGTLCALCLLVVAASAVKVSSSKVSLMSGKSHTLDTCPIFYLTLTNASSEQTHNISQWDIRRQNVDQAIAKHPKLNIKKINVLYWERDWQTIKDLFNLLGLTFERHQYQMSMNRGKIGRWATLIMMSAWQMHAQRACTIALEDDVAIPDDFQKRLHKVQQDEARPNIQKFMQYGEGYAFNSRAAGSLMKYLAAYPVIWMPTDEAINIGCFGTVEQVNVGVRKLVETNKGNIYHTPATELPQNDRRKAWKQLTKAAELAGEDLGAAAKSIMSRMTSFSETPSNHKTSRGIQLHASIEDFRDGENIDLVRAAKAMVRRMTAAKAP
eukprot:TRINITY_DN37051_c0_g1_i1.p1 TRINITY_DN37051_c0_g1~~TRINITY_DN37051_c0_g1_i1.p1  ORF type:complete len:331 (+),score=39.77 TRINITY_DN37051_c0_g1_i1:91-1083(+)